MNCARFPQHTDTRSRARFERAKDGDAGFSLVELVVAVGILLVTIIALMTLASTSNFMVRSATQRSQMVNAAAGYMDRVRQEPYTSIGVPGGDPVGNLTAQVTTVTPYVITVVPEVRWGRPEDTASHLVKTVVLTVSSVAIDGGSQMSFTTSALLADVGIVGVVSTIPTTPPVCEISAPTGGSVVWGTVSVTASATVGVLGRSLLWMDVVDGVQSFGSVVMSGSTGQHTWTWNTASAREGAHALVARATDSSTRVGNSRPATVTVDNLPPTVPAGLATVLSGDSGGSVWWTASTDGTDADEITPLPAAYYLLNAHRQPTDTTVASDYTRWTAVTGFSQLRQMQAPTAAAPLGLTGLSAFSRYAVDVRSCSSDRGASFGNLSAPAVTVGVTQYALAGTYTVAKPSANYDVTVRLNVPNGPTFPWSGNATTAFYRLTSSTQSLTGLTPFATLSHSSGAWSTAFVTDTQLNKPSPTRYWYVTVTTLTPSGYGSASTQVRSSVVAAPADLTTVGTRNMVFAQW